MTQLCWICVRRLGWPYDFCHSHQIWLCHNLSLIFSVFKISVTDISGLQWSRRGLHCHTKGLSVCPGTDSQQWNPATLLTCVGTVLLEVRFFWSWADAEELRGDLTLIDIYCFQVFSSKMKGLFTHESLMILSREAWVCAHMLLESGNRSSQHVWSHLHSSPWLLASFQVLQSHTEPGFLNLVWVHPNCHIWCFVCLCSWDSPVPKRVSSTFCFQPHSHQYLQRFY